MVINIFFYRMFLSRLESGLSMSVTVIEIPKFLEVKTFWCYLILYNVIKMNVTNERA